MKWRHYFEIYDRHLAKFAGEQAKLLEIGIYAGGSLDMWREYLGPGSELYGVDIDPYCTRFDEATVFIGDQADRAFWQRFRAETPPLDIVIDDGGHTVDQQRVTLEELLPHLRPGGVYICEDVHGNDNAFLGYVHGLSRELFGYDLTLDEASPDRVLSSPATPFQSAIHSVHVYPYRRGHRAQRPSAGRARGGQARYRVAADIVARSALVLAGRAASSSRPASGYFSGLVPAIQMMTRENFPSASTSKKLQLCMSFFVPSTSSPM